MRASVNVEYETGSSEESQEKYDPAVSVTLNMQRSEDCYRPGRGRRWSAWNIEQRSRGQAGSPPGGRRNHNRSTLNRSDLTRQRAEPIIKDRERHLRCQSNDSPCD